MSPPSRPTQSFPPEAVPPFSAADRAPFSKLSDGALLTPRPVFDNFYLGNWRGGDAVAEKDWELGQERGLILNVSSTFMNDAVNQYSIPDDVAVTDEALRRFLRHTHAYLELVARWQPWVVVCCDGGVNRSVAVLAFVYLCRYPDKTLADFEGQLAAVKAEAVRECKYRPRRGTRWPSFSKDARFNGAALRRLVKQTRPVPAEECVAEMRKRKRSV